MSPFAATGSGELVACVVTPAHALTVWTNVPNATLCAWSLRRPDGTLILSDVVRRANVPGLVQRMTGGAL